MFFPAQRLQSFEDPPALGFAQFGYRFSLDAQPALVDVGPGSPTGSTLGLGAKFPAKYQRAFFACDWTFATLYAIHLNAQGAA